MTTKNENRTVSRRSKERTAKCTGPFETKSSFDDGCVCINGYGIPERGTVCQECPQGTYNNVSVSFEKSQCIRCSENFVSGPGSAVCDRCKQNEMATNDRTTCICADGYGIGSDGKCQKCTGNNVNKADPSKTEKGRCTPCEPSTEVANGDNSICLCIDGYGVPLNGNYCEMCKAGTYNKVTQYAPSKGVCKDCPEGTYSADGAAECTKCVETAEISNSSRTACVCADGHGVTLGSSTCTACPAGTYHAQNSSSSLKVACTPCQDGEYSTERAQSCQTCPQDRPVSNAGRTDCVPTGQCGPNMKEANKRCHCIAGYGFNSATGVCEKCVPGTQRVEDLTGGDTGVCSPCQDGYANLFQTGCVSECGVGESAIDGQCYCAAGMQLVNDVCVACGEGSASPAGSNSCVVCAEGTVVSEDGSACVDPSSTNKVNMAAAVAVPIIAVAAAVATAATIMLAKKKKQSMINAINNEQSGGYVAEAPANPQNNATPVISHAYEPVSVAPYGSSMPKVSQPKKVPLPQANKTIIKLKRPQNTGLQPVQRKLRLVNQPKNELIEKQTPGDGFTRPESQLF